MWIKREGCETVNTDFVQSIKKVNNDDDDHQGFCIVFYQRNENLVEFFFEDEQDLNEYYDALMAMIFAQEVPMLKI